LLHFGNGARWTKEKKFVVSQGYYKSKRGKGNRIEKKLSDVAQKRRIKKMVCKKRIAVGTSLEPRLSSKEWRTFFWGACDFHQDDTVYVWVPIATFIPTSIKQRPKRHYGRGISEEESTFHQKQREIICFRRAKDI
jgi:hypothetical protein